MTDIATRVHNHNWKLDPIVRSLLDTDFYKLLMHQMILKLHPDVQVEFAVTNRTKSVRIADDIREEDLREQLDHARTVGFDTRSLIWLAGNSFYGLKQIFSSEYIERLKTYRLPEYELRRVDGQYDLRFPGRWFDTTMWEIHALAIVGELRSRAAMRKMGRLEIDILYARAKAKLWDKIERLQKLKNEGPLKIVDFGTRRRHSYLWQRWCVEALKAGLGDAFVGTSNVLMAMELGIEAIGTNAHELSMVYAAMAAPDEQAMKDARYKVLLDWASIYGGNLLVTLPDTYGTTNFLRDAPDWVANWTGARPDSKEPIAAGDELIAYWAAHGQDPKTKLLILSDGMDIVSIETCFHHFLGRARTSFGWGTNATNDFRGCMPSGGHALDPISLVCKVAKANGRGAVKLSDNLSKKTGKAEDIELYIKTYGTDGMANKAVDV